VTDQHSTSRGPDFVYIGTSKAGSTWLFNVLSLHEQVYLASNKGLYYFDGHYDKGPEWYLGHFDGAAAGQVRGEISHSYLSSPEVPARMKAVNPQMKLLACLREPVDRAFSDYLDLLKNMQFEGTFEEAIERYPRLLDRGRYATHLHRYLEIFPADQLHLSLFDDLKVDSQSCADSVFAFIGVGAMTLPPAALGSRMPAGTPRVPRVAAAAKSAARLMGRLGLRRLRSRVKRSARMRNALYRPYADDRPQVDEALARELRADFAAEVDELDALLPGVAARWGYGQPGASPPPGRATGDPVG
jgi:hypothetical protein